MKEVNLEELFKSQECGEFKLTCYISTDGFVCKAIKSMMKEACKQVLELAADKSNLIEHGTNKTAFTAHCMRVNKQSILDTINQVK